MQRFGLSKLAVLVAGVFAVGLVQAQVNERTFRIAINGAPGHPAVVGAEKWAEFISQKSGGKMTLKVFPSTLGGDVQVLSSVQGGTIDFASMNSGILQGIQKEFAIFDFPFMFDSGPEADKVLDGSFGKKLADLLPAKNLYNLAYWELGFRNITNGKRPIAKLGDLEGIKLRVIQAPIYIDTFTALGVNPVPMSFSELYPALEQKVIDGQENPTTLIYDAGFYEAQKYWSITRHFYTPFVLMIGQKSWDKLSPNDQKLVQKIALETREYERKVNRENNAKYLDLMKKKGIAINEVAPQDLEKFKASAKEIYEKFAGDIGKERLDKVVAEVAKVK